VEDEVRAARNVLQSHKGTSAERAVAAHVRGRPPFRARGHPRAVAPSRVPWCAIVAPARERIPVPRRPVVCGLYEHLSGKEALDLASRARARYGRQLHAREGGAHCPLFVNVDG
jgi:hypothetical protein